MRAQHHHLVPALSPLSEEQRRWLRTGLNQPGGKLSRCDEKGKRVCAALVRDCLQAGFVQAWSRNPVLGDSDIRICRLTEKAREALEADSVIKVDFTQWKKDTTVPRAKTVSSDIARRSGDLVSAAAGLRLQEDVSHRG